MPESLFSLSDSVLTLETDFGSLINYHGIRANNAYTFPGFGSGLIISGAIRAHDDSF